MSVLVVGMSHRSAPVALLEQLSMDEKVQHGTGAALVAQPSLSEAMIISTCNRMEVYTCLLYTSPSPRDLSTSRMPSSA